MFTLDLLGFLNHQQDRYLRFLRKGRTYSTLVWEPWMKPSTGVSIDILSDGRTPAPPGMYKTPWIMGNLPSGAGFQPSTVWQEWQWLFSWESSLEMTWNTPMAHLHQVWSPPKNQDPWHFAPQNNKHLPVIVSFLPNDLATLVTMKVIGSSGNTINLWFSIIRWLTSMVDLLTWVIQEDHLVDSPVTLISANHCISLISHVFVLAHQNCMSIFGDHLSFLGCILFLGCKTSSNTAGVPSSITWDVRRYFLQWVVEMTTSWPGARFDDEDEVYNLNLNSPSS